MNQEPLFATGKTFLGVAQEWCDSESRLAMVKRSKDAAWLDRVRRSDDVQKTVRTAADRRLRKLTKLAQNREDAKAPSAANGAPPSPAALRTI